MRTISPSLLSADFSNLKNEIDTLERLGIDRLHLDVMDGNFVPNLSFGPIIIHSIRNISKCHLETHLMINNPHNHIDKYIKAGSDTIIVHLEASINPKEDLSHIRNHNICAGIAINPSSDENKLVPLLDYIDYILIMSVFPGSGGQLFIEETLMKMTNIVSMRKNRNIIIGVDGGVNLNTISNVYNTGIDITIVGSGLFNSKNISQRYTDLLNA